MEIAYLMVGKRFQARDIADLNQQLAQYNLRTNSDDVCEGVRRSSDSQGMSRYLIQQSRGDPAEFEGYDVVVGKELGNSGHGQPDVVEVEPSQLESTLNEVKEDVPDAKLIAGSYWS
ncbi:hypothetical protein GOV06_01610 [Candidatus Woesearchaeota archaeon]|nr:hypothetical protein [Candidatus Woesearchaeota archaeon]